MKPKKEKLFSSFYFITLKLRIYCTDIGEGKNFLKNQQKGLNFGRTRDMEDKFFCLPLPQRTLLKGFLVISLGVVN
jgi:hypothetical protein